MKSKTSKTKDTKDILSSSELLRSEAIFRIVFDNLIWTVMVFDVNGCLININAAGEKMFGTTKEIILGVRLFESPNLSDELKEKLRKGEAVDLNLRYDFSKVNQQSFYKTRYTNIVKYIRGKCIPLKEEDGQVFGYLYLVYDDTENHLFKVKEMDRLRSAFMANMSHEIRTPLNAIVGFSNILVDMNETPETEFFREAINKNNTLLLKLVDDILDFTSMEMGTLEFRMDAVPVKELCDEVIRIYEPMVKEGVILSFTPEDPACIIHADRKRLRQVISQLMGNAVKYTSSGSISLSYSMDETMFAFELTDTGIGIPEKDRKAIFDCFYQVDHFHQGTGLGLSIAKSLVEGMGGTIGVDSIEGQGSTFWFTLPLFF